MWAAGTVAAVLLFACYLRQSATVAVGSDGASQALQAWDLLHGNPLLRGWWVTDVSFYTTELPQYALIELACGLNANVIHLAGAMTYTLLVLAAAFLARGRARGAAGLTRALLAAGIMLAPQLGPGTQTLLLSPDHTGTAVPVLLIFLLIDRAPGRWYIPVLVWAGLAWTALADAMTIFVAVLPIAVVCTADLARATARRGTRSRSGFRAGQRPPAVGRGPRAAGTGQQAADGRSGRGPQAALAVAAALAVPAELLAAALIRALGGWQVNGLRTGLAGAGQLAGNARLAGEGLLELFGADVFGAAGRVGAALAVVHLAGAVLAAAGAVTAAARFFAAGRLVERILLTAIVIDLAAYLAGVQAVNIASTREIAPVLPFAAVLAGRCLGGPLSSRLRRRRLRCGLAAVLALYAAGLGYAAAQPPAAPQYADLAAWLRAHHLTAGLSGYHQANIVTLQTGGAVTLRAVTAGSAGQLAAYQWNARAGWYDPARHSATFLVLAAPGAGPPGPAGLTTRAAVATFGRPISTERYDGYVILIWRPGENLLTGLDSGQSASRAVPNQIRKQDEEVRAPPWPASASRPDAGHGPRPSTPPAN
jgi:hypothetical protein